MSYGTNNRGGGYGNQKHRSGGRRSTYKGHSIEFVKQGDRFWARAPDITTQYLGVGKSKSEALEDAKPAIDKLKDLKEEQTGSMADLEEYLRNKGYSYKSGYGNN